MKKYLLPQSGNFYKANLHSHTTVSDGNFTPKEVKRIYKENGYSIVAFTDHNVMVAHPELADEDFLPLSGYELDIAESGDCEFKFRKACHICYIALDPDNLLNVCYHRNKYLFANEEHLRDTLCYDKNKPDFERVYSHECITQMMKEGRENGFFVTYNHPSWSMEEYTDYMGYNYMHAMEICNNGSLIAGLPEYNEKEYDSMLRGGKRIFCIAADDNHNYRGDSFGAFTVIKADKLEYKTITNALLAGNFYSSQGPEIYELWYEDGKLGIRCSDARRISLVCAVRYASNVIAPEGEVVNYAEFEVKPDLGYVRITVEDVHGKHANTNAYFIDELIK